jgi:rhodanese-related sulfurtransferase
VGLPDLAPLGRAAILVEWQVFPSMARNARFESLVGEHLKGAGADTQTPIAFICRSGARSRAAAIAMTATGYARCFNVAGGFEGDLGTNRHRGETNGWKAQDLPWLQT